MNRTLLTAWLCAFLFAPLGARALLADDGKPAAATEQQVTVVTKDGRRLEGVLVKEDDSGVVIRMKLGAEVPVGKAEIQEIIRAGAGGAEGAQEGEDEGGGVETHTIFTLKDGAVVRGRATDKGTYWEVENDLGTIRVEKSLVRSSRTEQVRRGVKQESPAEREEARDLSIGLSLARPGPQWHFALSQPDPLARIVMRRDDPLVVFRVALAEPFPPELRDADPALRAKVQDIVQKELKERWRSVRGLTLDVERFHGTPTWRATYQADARVFGSKFVFRELYLPHRDGRLVLQAYAPLDQEKAAQPEMAAAFQGFSFIGSRTDAGGDYVDFPLGVRVPKPRADWRLHVRLFDDAVPMELLPPDGVGRFRLEVAPPQSGVLTPAAAADSLEKTLAVTSRGFRRGSRSEKNLSGVPAVDLRYQNTEGSVAMDVRRLIMVREQRVIQFVAATPAPPEGDKKGAGASSALADRAALSDALLDSIDALIEESPLAACRRGQKPMDLLVQGSRKLEEAKEASAAIAILTQALELAPSFGQAYLVRGKAYADTGDYKRAMKDYDAAGDIIDDPALGKLIATAETEQAKRIAKDDFDEARKLWLSAIRHDPATRTYKEDLSRATMDYVRGLTSANKYESAIEELKEAERRFPDDGRYRRECVKVHLDWARRYQNEGELYQARSVLKRAQRLDPENGSIKSMIERLEADIKKKEEGDPKKGKKK